jgi:HEPN domain-containing protein
MLSKQEHIAYWLAQADDDWQTVDILFAGGKYLQTLFWAHLVLEKICKCLWIQHNSGNVPPRSHNLNRLLALANIVLTDEQHSFLAEINQFQLEGRYPDYIANMRLLCTREVTSDYIHQTNALRLCLRQLLQIP